MIELMITLVVLAILLTVAVPSFNASIRDSRNMTGSNSLVAGMNEARAEAIRRGRYVSLCPSKLGTACDAGATWADGWISLVEVTTVKAGDAPTKDTTEGNNGVLQVGSAIKNTTVTRTAGNQNYVRFGPRGQSEEAITLNITPNPCKTGWTFRQVAVGLAGRPSVTRASCP